MSKSLKRAILDILKDDKRHRKKLKVLKSELMNANADDIKFGVCELEQKEMEVEQMLEKLQKKKKIEIVGKHVKLCLVCERISMKKATIEAIIEIEEEEVEDVAAEAAADENQQPTRSTDYSMTYEDKLRHVQDMYEIAAANILNKKKGYCTHGKKEAKCKECDGSAYCEHDTRRDRCKICGGAAFCQHKRRKIDCPKCQGSRCCAHGRVKRFCKDCGGTGLCIHKKRVYMCHTCKKEKSKNKKEDRMQTIKELDLLETHVRS